MTDADGHRIEAAEQFGFEAIDPDCETYICTSAELIAFAKACERAGRAQAAQLARKLVAAHEDHAIHIPGVSLFAREAAAGCAEALAEHLETMNAASDAELAPLLEAERLRSIAASTRSEILERE